MTWCCSFRWEVVPRLQTFCTGTVGVKGELKVGKMAQSVKFWDMSSFPRYGGMPVLPLKRPRQEFSLGLADQPA